MATNLESAYHLSQLAHPLLKSSGMGSIVFMSSVAGLVSVGVGSVYAATKGELLRKYYGLTKASFYIHVFSGFCFLFFSYLKNFKL